MNIENKNKIIEALKKTVSAQNSVLEQYENGIQLAIAQLEESESIPFALDALHEALGTAKEKNVTKYRSNEDKTDIIQELDNVLNYSDNPHVHEIINNAKEFIKKG